MTGLSACAALLTSPDLRFPAGDTPVLIRESGAIIVGKRQVGNLVSGGKVVDSFGRMVAIVHEDSLRLRGGINLPIKTDPEGSLFIPTPAQTALGLEPVEYRIRPDGTMARTRGAKGIPYEGPRTRESRRLILLVLVLTANGMWS